MHTTIKSPLCRTIADFVGDSLELSINAIEANAKLIVFAGVDFMVEQATMLNENAVVLHPNPQAKYPMAKMITVEDVGKARSMHPNAPVAMYVNSPAEVKAKSDLYKET